MSDFQIFAADAAFQNRVARDFFTHPTKKNALSFPDFCQKACIAHRVVAAGERRGLLGVGFENLMRSWVLK